MKSFVATIAVVSGLTFAGSAMSADMPPLAKKLGCTSCHAIDHKLVGPAWQAVADKYKGDPGAKASLIAKVTNGGSGVWGYTPMPPHKKDSQADITELVTFILNLAK